MLEWLLIEENEDDLRHVLGPHQSSVKVKNGPGMDRWP